jgi:hypothetical protein
MNGLLRGFDKNVRNQKKTVKEPGESFFTVFEAKTNNMEKVEFGNLNSSF